MIEHLSYSSISAYLLCGRNWRYKYLDKIPTKTTSGLILGSAFHDAIECLLSRGKEEEPEEIFKEAFSTQIERNGDNIDWQNESPESVLNDGIRLFKSNAIIDGIKSIKPKLNDNGAMIEQKIELSVPYVPVPIVGYIDIILEDGTPADFKTSAKRWSDDQAQNSMQSLFYIAALDQAGFYQNVESRENYKFTHLVFVKTKEPAFQKIEHWHSTAELFFLMDVISSCWNGISAGVFTPNPDSWKCNPRFCEYWDICKGAATK